MYLTGWVFGIICLITSFVVVYFARQETKQTMEALDSMLERALGGEFLESSFDESMLSSLESRFALYLSSSAISAQNVTEEKNRIKELIGDISHQTKTPIANLLLYTELLQEENLSHQSKLYVDTLYAQVKKLQFLINALVKLSRLENGVISLKAKNQSLYPVLQQAKSQFEAKALDKGLEIVICDTDESACFDFEWTLEALCNLLDNAVKYTENGSITLSVVRYEFFIRIAVTDTGIGIPESQQAQIFSRFYRGDNHESQEGVGIGLYLAREILQKEGGYIKVFSHPGKGSEFSMFLPV